MRTCLRQSGEQVLIFVSDTGGGIAPSAVEHIFEPFSQLDSSVARRHGGLGLGLTIARKLVDGMGATSISAAIPPSAVRPCSSHSRPSRSCLRDNP